MPRSFAARAARLAPLACIVAAPLAASHVHAAVPGPVSSAKPLVVARTRHFSPPPRPTIATPPKGTIAVPRGAAVSNVNVLLPPGGSPAPAQLPNPFLNGPPLPASAAARCNAQACTSPSMPFFNQGNPNFAQIQAPGFIYDAEKHPIGGKFVDDNGRDAIDIPPLDPYFDTWLPYGPLPGDDGNIGYWFTAICAPTAESMALVAALAQKSKTTIVKSGSWTDVSFVQAQRPGSQAPIATPLATDHTTRAPNSYQMTTDDLQRVVNMAMLQKTDPTAGGLMYAFLQAANDVAYGALTTGPVAPHQVAWTEQGKTFDDGTFEGLFRKGFVMTVGLHKVQAHVSATQVTFTYLDFGHVLALNGFKMNGQKPEFIVYDPVYANTLSWGFEYIHPGSQTVAGATRNVVTPNGGALAVVPAYAGYGHDASALNDGGMFWVVDEWAALRLE